MDDDAERVGNRAAEMLLDGPPAQVASRIHRQLQSLSKHAPPRGCAAVFHTIWNGWCTARRFQQRGSAKDRCWLGCPEGASDSIEHYCRCPIGLDILRKRLNISLPQEKALTFWLLGDYAQGRVEVLAIGALFTYAMYNATNYYRHNGAPSSDRAKECIKQHLIQGCQGHKPLTKMLDSCWARATVYI